MPVSSSPEVTTWTSAEHRLVVAHQGARVLEYSIAGHNVISSTGPFVQQGSTFWLAPQSAWPRAWPPPSAVDEAEYTHTRDGDAVVFTSPPVPEYGVVIEKRVALRSDGVVAIDYTATAQEKTVQWAAWEVTRLRPGLCVFATGRSEGAILDPEVPPIESVTWDGITWVPFPRGNARFRTLLADAHDWAGYAHDGLLFLKRFAPVAAHEFAPGNGSLKIWWQDSDFIELEQLGPYRELAPGQALTWHVEWSLAAIDREIPLEPGSPELVALLPALG